MKSMRIKMSCRAFTKVDLLIIAATLVLLGVALPYLTSPKPTSAARIRCVNNLKSTAFGFRIWSADNNDTFPMAVSTNQGGTMEFTKATDAFWHFVVLSNELSTPKILACPNDNRVPAADFTNLSNTNISYFVGLDAEEVNPQSILSGDRNLTQNGKLITGLFPITTNTVLGWSSGIHQHAGNIALGDGSVQQVTSSALAELVRNSSGTNRLLIP